jgi:hypothetical protein
LRPAGPVPRPPCRSQRNALVGGAKHHVELDTTGQQRFCIKFCQTAQLGPVVKQARVEEVGAQTPGFGLELPKPQHARLHRKTHKILRQTALLRGVRANIPPWEFLVQVNQPQSQRHPIGHQQGLEAGSRHAAGLYLRAGSQGPGGRHGHAISSSLPGCRGISIAPRKKATRVGVYTRHEPSDIIIGYGSPEFDAEGRYVELRFDTPARKLSIISAYFPQRLVGRRAPAGQVPLSGRVPPAPHGAEGHASSSCAATSTLRTSRST